MPKFLKVNGYRLINLDMVFEIIHSNDGQIGLYSRQEECIGFIEAGPDTERIWAELVASTEPRKEPVYPGAMPGDMIGP